MRKFLRRTAFIGLVGMASPGLAQDSNDLELQTTVPAYCQSAPWGQSASMDLDQLIDESTGYLKPAFSGTSSLSTLASYYCNSKAKVTLFAEPLLNPGLIVSGEPFVNRVDYTATIHWNQLSLAASSQGAVPTELTTTQAHSGIMQLALSNPVVPVGNRPIAGSYSGQVTVTVAAQP